MKHYYNLKKNILLLLSLLCAELLTAQAYVDLVKLDYSITPPNNFDNSQIETELREINGDLTLPIVINDRATLLTGLSYENIYAAFEESLSKESVTGLTLKLGTNLTHNEKWSGTYMLLPKIASDWEDIGKRDFQIGAVVIMKRIKNKHFSYKFGAYSNSELFGPLVVPLFGFYYLNPAEKFEAKILLPLAADASYLLRRDFRFGLNFRGQVRSSNIHTPIGMESNPYLVKNTQELLLYCQYEMQNGINVQLGVGRSVGRSYRLYNDKVSFGIPLHYFGDDRTQLNQDFADSWLFKLGIFYRLHLSDTDDLN